MFQRFTESARRAVFFARYEASQYGSARIGPEHLLLGVAREDRQLVWRSMGHGSAEDIRTQIEKRITRGSSPPTSVEIPLTDHARKALLLAVEESDKLGHPHVGTDHLLLGILAADDSVAAQILRDRGVKLEEVREKLKNASGAAKAEPRPSIVAMAVLDGFLVAIKQSNAIEISSYLAKGAQLFDCYGKSWQALSRPDLEVLFAPYSKRNATFFLEGSTLGPADSVVASVIWDNVMAGEQSIRSRHRMTVVLGQSDNDWGVFLLQVTPVVVR